MSEKWTISELTPQSIVTPHGRISVSWSSSDRAFDKKAEETARRIVAAVNACAGIDTETLERLTDQEFRQFLTLLHAKEARLEEATRLLERMQQAHCVAYCDIHDKTHTHACQEARAFLESGK